MIRKAPTGIAILVVCIGLVLVAAYWVTEPYRESLRKQRDRQRDSIDFRDHLVAEIEGADQIDLVEHSGRLDFIKADGPPDNEHPTIEYARITLNISQKKRLAAIVRGVDVKPKETFTLCICDPHHTFEFRKDGVLSQWLSVCFQSRYIKWYIKPGDPWIEEQRLEPEELISAFRNYVKDCGFRVGVNWHEIAEQD